MATKIKHKRSAVAGKSPLVSQLESGELAINTADGKVFLLRDDNTVQDITQRIFQGDSEVKVTDDADSTLSQIAMTVNGDEKMTVTNAGFNMKDNIDIENANSLTFRELTASGEDGVTLKAPNTLPGSYNLTLPLTSGVNGQLLSVDDNGQLSFTDSDVFGGNVIYVSAEKGDDTNDGQSAPVKTIKKACQLASAIVYNSDGSITNTRVNVKVAVGDYTEDNPVIIPDNVVIKGDGLRGCIVRPANANLDMFRVRNACYFGEFTFRDGVDDNFVPLITFDYATVFDDPDATDVTDRADYTNLPNTKPAIFTSPYIQNCSIISFLGGSGAKIDGALVQSPNVPTFAIEAENPAIGAVPEQGKSMVANAYTMLSFGGTGWRLLNDAYAQIVSCFQIFLLNGVYTQSGGYCSITNSATNFGLYALRSSGYSPKAFQFDRGFVTATGESEGKQTITMVGINRDAPVEEFVLRFREPGYKEAYDRLLEVKNTIADDTVTWINSQISGASPSIWAGFTYDEDKCVRDTKLMVDRIRYDIAFNSNYRSVSAALTYFNGNFPNFADQQDQHVAAFGQAKIFSRNLLTDSTAITRSDALWDEVIDILTNGDANTVPGDSVAAAYTRPDPTNYDTGFSNARAQIIANKEFFKDEVTAWIADQVAAQNAPFDASFTYDSAKCERDIGLIIDALVYDLTYRGNLQTIDAATQYFVGTAAQYGNGKKEETIAAYERLKDVVGEAIQELTITTSSGTTETQDTSGTPGSGEAAGFAIARLQEIIDYIDDDGTVAISEIAPDITWTSATAQAEFAAHDDEAQKNIAQNVTAYINAQIQANIWYNFTYDQAKCRRDTQLIVDAVAKDTWDTGNRYSTSAGRAYYTRNIADSSNTTIAGQELQTEAAIDRAKTTALTYLTSLSVDVQDFVSSRFDIIADAVVDPLDIPVAVEVSSEGDITNNYKTNASETTFNAATAVNVTTNIISITGHGFTNGQKIIYDSNSNALIGGLDQEQTYYVKLINEDEFSLTFDDSLEFDVDIFSAGTGTHKLLSGVIEFFVEEVTSSHTTYQTLILESGAESYEFTPGKSITGTTGSNNNSAIVTSWEPQERRLIVSIEEVVVGSSTLRIQFDATSTITQDHASSPNTTIGVNEVAAKTGLGTATFTITATDGSSSLTNLVNLPEKQIWFHRPSIVNSSAHTWEYAGSGTDYNALPQNGGNTREEYEQFEELPGRCYSSGTNELGDFKVGDFITAFNRTGNITFRNKVQVDELDALRLSLSDVAIEEISTSVNLGDDEQGGASNARLSTQLAVRSFISNRLGGFVDKSVSSAAVPGAIVQLNVNGQLNPDLIPATRQFTNTNTEGYLSRLEQIDDIPATDLKAGDIATEEYEQVELTLSGNITASDGDTITQTGVTGAIGYAKGDYSNSGNILVATIGAAWDETDDSTGDPWEVSAGNLFVNGADSGVNVSSKGVSSEIIDNFFLRSSNTSQFLVLDPDDSYTFTSATLTNVERTSNIATITTSGAHNLRVGNSVAVDVTGSLTTFDERGKVLTVPSSTTFTIANTGSDVSSVAETGTVRTLVTSADGAAQGSVTETRFGVLTNVDNTDLTGGSLYTPTGSTKIYENVSLTNNSGSGSGAKANITVTNGEVTDVDLSRGGTGYAVGDLLSANASDIGGTGSGFECEVTTVEKRAYVNIIGGELFVASASSIDFVEDNAAVDNTFEINLDDVISHNFLAGTTGGGGAVNYTDSRITIANHGLSNGDPVTYDTLGNVAIGGLTNGLVYYAKAIDTSTIELYDDFSLVTQIDFTSTPANNNHNITRHTVNITDNSIVVEGHGLTTGDAIRIESLDDGSTTESLPTVGGTAITGGSRFFVGSVTTNSFTIHALRSDALSSINGLVTNARNIDGKGVGSAEVIPNNVQVNAQVNTSSRIKSNWSTLAVTNIDAENIISGTISPSRLASSGTANTDTFLRGDSSYQTVVQSIKKANTTDNPITLTGSSLNDEFYGDPVNIGISNVDYDPLGTFSTLGTSKFLQSQFDVNSNASGEVFIKDGVVDAGTLDSLDSAYFLNPANLTSLVPVNKGGTNISTYAIGDILYAQSSGSLNTLNIGRQNSFLKSNGTVPEWGTALDLAEGLDVGSAKLSSDSTSIGRVYNDNVTTLEMGGDSDAVKIGKNDPAERDLATFVVTYEANITQDVVANLATTSTSTNQASANGENVVFVADTSNIQAGMTVAGSGSIPANTVVNGITSAGEVFLSNDLTGTVTSGTALTFTYTPLTLGIREGDYITISGSGITNLDGTWPVTGATDNASSFTVQTDANVTANPAQTQSGTITRENATLIRPKALTVGGAGHSGATPEDAIIRAESGIGTDVAGGTLNIQGGTSTGNAAGGDVVIKTGARGSTGDIAQTQTARLTIDVDGKAAFTGEVEVNDTISTTETTVSLLDTTATTINMGGAATTVDIGAATGTTTIKNNLDVEGDFSIVGDVLSTDTTGAFNLINTNATTLNIGGAATTVSIGASGGTTTINGNLTVSGDTTTLNTSTLNVEDINITVANGAANAAAANGAGLTIDGANVTFTYDSATDRMDLNEDLNLTSGNAYFINDASVLNSTTLGSAVVNSSLTSVGTIATGTWQGSIISPTYGGTGVNNGTKTITLGGNFTHSGAHTLTLTTTGNTGVTLPTSGTLAITGNPLSQFASTTSAQLRGVLSDETGTGVAVFGTSPNFTTSVTTGSTTFAAFNTNATTVNAFGAATTLTVGATSGTTRVRNNLDVDGDINIDGGDLTFSDTTINIANATSTTVNFGQAATTLTMGATTGTATIRNATTTLNGNLNVNGTQINTDETGTFELIKDNATTLAFAQAATSVVMGATTGTTQIRHNVDIDGNLNIDGTLDIPAIDDVPIGQTTPAAGSFTTLSANNLVTFTDATNATGTFAAGSAAVKITGGLHVAKDVRADNFIGDMSAANLTSGTVPDARIASSSITQHQGDITGTGALNSGSITSGFGNINIGTSIFSGDGSGLTTLNASELDSGTVADARIASSSITQHQGDITGTGALNSGSISSGFGNINIGTSTFSGNGSGLTTLNATNLSSGTVDGARLGGNQSMAGVKTFTDTSAASSTTTGAVRVDGGMGVQGAIYGGSFNGNGSGLTQLNANNIATGTVPNARIDGNYSNITGVGTLDSGAISSNFGNIDIGTSTFTGNGSGLTNVDAATLDGIDSSQFVRSDAADTMTGMLTLNHAGDEMIRLQDTSATGNPYISWYQAGNRRAYMQFVDSGNRLRIYNDVHDDYIDLLGGVTGLKHNADGTEYTVWTSGNDGSGSGLDSDTVDGQQAREMSWGHDFSHGTFTDFNFFDSTDYFGAHFVQGTSNGPGVNGATQYYHSRWSLGSNYNNYSMQMALGRNVTEPYVNIRYEENGSWGSWQKISAGNSDKLQGYTWNNVDTFIQSNNEIRAYDGAIELKSNGIYFESEKHMITWNDGRGNFNIRVGQSTGEVSTETGYAFHHEWSQSSGWHQINATSASVTAGNSVSWGRTWQFTASNGNFTSPGEVTAFSSDARLKENLVNVPNALDKVMALNGVIYNWKDKAVEAGLGVDPSVTDVGVLAQEVEAVLPEAVAPAPFDHEWDEENKEWVSKSGENYKTVKYERLTALLIEAMKEQQEQIDDLKEQIKNLTK